MRSRAEKQKEYVTDPGDTVMAMLLSFDQFPVSRRPTAMRTIALHYEALYREMKLPVPEWVGLLAKLADDLEKDRTEQN